MPLTLKKNKKKILVHSTCVSLIEILAKINLHDYLKNRLLKVIYPVFETKKSIFSRLRSGLCRKPMTCTFTVRPAHLLVTTTTRSRHANVAIPRTRMTRLASLTSQFLIDSNCIETSWRRTNQCKR